MDFSLRYIAGGQITFSGIRRNQEGIGDGLGTQFAPYDRHTTSHNVTQPHSINIPSAAHAVQCRYQRIDIRERVVHRQ
jgi:hypothetical protein